MARGGSSSLAITGGFMATGAPQSLTRTRLLMASVSPSFHHESFPMSGQANPDVGLFRALKGRGRPHDFMAICPAHRDRNPSLHVTIKDGATLVHCFAGCTQDAV